MARTVAEVESEIASKKAAGVHQASREMVALRAERDALLTPQSAPAPVAASTPPPASDDVAFIHDALAQMLLREKGVGSPERAYSNIQAALRVKHIIEDATGIASSGRVTIPNWATLNRDKDSGEPFSASVIAAARAVGVSPQQVVNGEAQRAVPAPKGVPVASRPSITTQDGRPISLSRSRVLDEPEGNAEFVTESLGSAE